MMSDLLSALDASDVGMFYRDFRLLMKLAVETDKGYARADSEISHNMPKYEEYIKLFNKKYPGILITPSANYERRFMPEIFIKKEKSVKEAFLNSASKIHRVKAVSSSGCLQKDEMHDEAQLRRELSKMKNKVCVQYFGMKSPTLFLSFNSARQMVEICYDPETVCDSAGPEFKVIAYYAVKDSEIDYDTDLQKIGEGMSASAEGVDSSMGGTAPLK